MTHLLRFLALYDWPEAFDLSKHPEILVGLVEDAQIAPYKGDCLRARGEEGTAADAYQEVEAPRRHIAVHELRLGRAR